MMPSNNQEPFVTPQVPGVNTFEFERSSTPLFDNGSSDDVEYDLEAQLKAMDEIKPSKIMGDMKPSISELAKLYQEKKSRIDRFVEWYSNQSRSNKILLGGAVVSTSFAVGSLLGMTWLFTGLVTGLYVTAISIIEEHAKITRNRDAFTAEGAEKIEALIDEHIKTFQALEEQLHTVFQSLNEQHTQRAEGISMLEAHVDNVGDYNQRYASVIELLENTSKKLLEHQEGVALTEAELHALYADIQSSFESVNTLTATLSDVVSSVEQELKHNVVEKAQEKIGEESSVNQTIERSDKVIGDARQTLSKLREAAKARKEANAAQEKLYDYSSAPYNML